MNRPVLVVTLTIPFHPDLTADDVLEKLHGFIEDALDQVANSLPDDCDFDVDGDGEPVEPSEPSMSSPECQEGFSPHLTVDVLASMGYKAP